MVRFSNVSTLHGGTVGYDRVNWTVVDTNSSWVRFSNVDPAGNQGFPGAVNTTVDYWLENNATWRIAFHSNASAPTPILLSSHVFWNLEAYNETESILNYTMWLPQVTNYVKTDGILIPTGEMPSVNGTGYDFSKPTVMNDLFNMTEGYCGTGCKGWDSCFVFDNHTESKPNLEWWSSRSGIKMTVHSDQIAMQLYSCPGIQSATKNIPRKQSQGGSSKFYINDSCGVIEQESVIDAINQPEWKINQIYSPERPYEWNSVYQFSTISENGTAIPRPAIINNGTSSASTGSGSGNSNGAAASAAIAPAMVLATALLSIFAALS